MEILSWDHSINTCTPTCMSMHIMVVIPRWSSISPKWVHCSLQRLQVIECYPMLHVYVPPPILLVILTLLLATDWTFFFIPGVVALVRHLHSHGVPIAVATSSSSKSYNVKISKKSDFFTLCLLWWQGDETWQASSWYLPYCCKQIQQPPSPMPMWVFMVVPTYKPPGLYSRFLAHSLQQ